MADDLYSLDWLLPRYGMFALPYAAAFPDLTNTLRKLYRDRLAKFPGLPYQWWQSIDALHGKNGQVLFPVSSTATDSAGQTPVFLKTDAQRAAWDSIVEELNAVRQAMLAKEGAKGAALVQAAYDRVAFWDKAYQVANVLALPVTAAKAAWDNPWLTGTLVWGGLGLLAILALRRTNRD